MYVKVWQWIFVAVGASAPPPPPSLRTSGYLYARSPSPEPSISGKGYTPYLWYWLPLAITKNTPFSGLSVWEIFPRLRPKNTPFPEKMGIGMQRPHAFEWGGGGGGSEPRKIEIYLTKEVNPNQQYFRQWFKDIIDYSKLRVDEKCNCI